MKMLDTVVSRTLGIYSIIREENLQEHDDIEGRSVSAVGEGFLGLLLWKADFTL